MFKNLVAFSYKRTTKEAIGFYVAYLVVIILASALSGGLFGLITGNENSFSFGVRIGNIIAIVTTLFLAFLILKSKNLFGNFLYLVLALTSGILAYFGGGLLGLILVAYLTTRNSGIR